jgi:hypothetical protein
LELASEMSERLYPVRADGRRVRRRSIEDSTKDMGGAQQTTIAIAQPNADGNTYTKLVAFVPDITIV